jgi:hypothetical protein
MFQSSGECGVSTGGFGVDMGSIELEDVNGVEVPGASRTDFTGVTVLQASQSNERWGAELSTGGRGG